MMKNTFQYLLVTLVAISMFSCNILDITKKRYSNGYHVSTSKFKKEKKEVLSKANNDEIVKYVLANNNVKTATSDETPVIESATINTSTAIVSTNSDNEQVTSAKNKSLFVEKINKSSNNRLQLLKEKLIEKIARTNPASSSSDADVALLLLVILAILLPPLAVFLVRGLDTMFLISLILTLLFWIPGVIFALLVVFDVI